MKIAVICVLHNNAKTLRKTWDGWVAAGRKDVDWYFWDNASDDDTIEMFNALHASNPLPGFKNMTCSNANLFFGKGVNARIRSVIEPYDGYVLFNPDIILQTNFFDNAIASILSRVECLGSWAPALLGEDGVPDGNAGPMPTCATEFREWTGIAKLFGVGRFFRSNFPIDDQRLNSVRHAWLGAGLLYVPREVWKRTGGFDEGYSMYMEDIDLGLRIGALGYDNVRDAQVRATHIGRASSSNALFRFEHVRKSAMRLYKTYMPVCGILLRPVIWARRMVEYIRHANIAHT